MNTLNVTTTHCVVKSIVLNEGVESLYISPISTGSYHSPRRWIKAQYEAYVAATYGTDQQQLIGIYPLDNGDGGYVNNAGFDLMRWNWDMIKINGLDHVDSTTFANFYLPTYNLVKPVVYTPNAPYYFRIVYFFIDDFSFVKNYNLSQLDVNTKQLAGVNINSVNGIQAVSVPLPPGTAPIAYPPYTHK